MRETTRKYLTDVLSNEMGINPKFIARDGANSDGYYVFTGMKSNGRERLRSFVTWTPEQKAVIAAHQDEFDEWFGCED